MERYEPLSILPDVEDFDELKKEFVGIYLQRSRAMMRMNRGWDRKTQSGGLQPRAYQEFEIADLYLDRLSRREERVTAALEQGVDRMCERTERLGPHLRAIELLVAGMMSARRSAAATVDST